MRRLLLIALAGAALAAPAHAADRLAYRHGHDAALERAAAAGHSHVLYALSPGGVFATAARTARFRGQIERAARGSGFRANTLEAMVFLESAGRPDVMAGGDPAGAAGLAQIMPQTGHDFLGMHVDVTRSRRLTRAIERSYAHGRLRRTHRLEARRRSVDQRFSPRAALAGMVLYLERAHGYLGRNDLAIASYHMGIGNLQSALRAYGATRIPYVRLYFDSAPDRHARAWRTLASMSDDSRHYYFKVLAAKEIMRLYRTDQRRLAGLAELHSHKLSGEEAARPPWVTGQFHRPAEIRAAWHRGRIVALPRHAGLVYDRGMGSLARRLHRPRALYRGLRPQAAATLAYIGHRVRQLSRSRGSLIVTSTLRDHRYQRLLLARNSAATAGYSLHTTGYAFDIARQYRGKKQAAAFEFVLERLQSLGMIEWIREPYAIHVAVTPRAAALLKAPGSVKPARVRSTGRQHAKKGRHAPRRPDKHPVPPRKPLGQPVRVRGPRVEPGYSLFRRFVSELHF